MTPTLYAVAVELNGDPDQDEGHHSLALTYPMDWLDFWERAADADKAPALRWIAGVVGRVAIQLANEMARDSLAARHGCANRWTGNRYEIVCGAVHGHGTIDQNRALLSGDTAWAEITVPANEAKRWEDRARQLISKLVTADATPPPPDPAPADPAHEQTHITDPTPARKAST